MEFKPFHLLHFNAKVGAFSKVTEREFFDSQITLTDLETDLVINHFGRTNIHTGNVASDKVKASKAFFSYNENKLIDLNLVFPKPKKAELRLYLSSKKGFKPSSGSIWFLYVSNNGGIVIGALDEVIWNNLGQLDFEDNFYSAEIDLILKPSVDLNINPSGKIITKIVGSKTIYQRDPKLAAYRFNLTNYQCEIDPQHNTFTSAKTEKPFVEAHHYIPMKFQSLFSIPLDNVENIISLCPNCHRGFHHAIIDEKLELISNIYSKRPTLSKDHTLEEIAAYYNCIKI